MGRFDVVYLQDWANPGFRSIRERRFSTSPAPVFVTVLHGPSPWIRSGNRKLPAIPTDLQVDFIERYSAEHSDYIIAPSRYISGWLKRIGWKFRRDPEVLPLPYHEESAPPVNTLSSIARVVFFGRLEIRKGFEIFADALRHLCEAQHEVLAGVQEIVLLGQEQEPGSVTRLRRILAITGVAVVHLSDLDSAAARAYLTTHVCDSLVVIPSPFENFPYAVIEASSIPGLNLICSRGGGTPEVLGAAGEAQLFDPTPAALAAAIAERLQNPLKPDQLALYDSATANAGWMRFHRRICTERAGVPNTSTARRRSSVDVCIPYYNKGRYLQQVLLSLRAQTEKGVGVIVVDDGSADSASRVAFDAAASEYADRNWKFVRQANAFVDAARNNAARLSNADYLLFLDADDIPVTDAIERLLDAAELSGLDCLLTGGWLFDSDDLPYNRSTGALTVRDLVAYLPLGPDLVGGLVDPMVFGLPMILIKRAVFDIIGGYRECRGAGHEDWELQIRLLLAGFHADVLPEYLVYFRRTGDGLSRTGDVFASKLRLIEAFNAPLREAGMCGLGAALFHLDNRCRELQDQLIRNVPLSLRLQFHDLHNT